MFPPGGGSGDKPLEQPASHSKPIIASPMTVPSSSVTPSGAPAWAMTTVGAVLPVDVTGNLMFSAPAVGYNPLLLQPHFYQQQQHLFAKQQSQTTQGQPQLLPTAGLSATPYPYGFMMPQPNSLFCQPLMASPPSSGPPLFQPSPSAAGLPLVPDVVNSSVVTPSSGQQFMLGGYHGNRAGNVPSGSALQSSSLPREDGLNESSLKTVPSTSSSMAPDLAPSQRRSSVDPSVASVSRLKENAVVLSASQPTAQHENNVSTAWSGVNSGFDKNKDQTSGLLSERQTLISPARRFASRGLAPTEDETWMSSLTVKQLVDEFTELASLNCDASSTVHHLGVPAMFRQLLTPYISQNLMSDTTGTTAASVHCDVCFEVQRPPSLSLLGDLMVTCCDCGITVHRRCYGVHRIIVSKNVRSQRSRRQFLCDACRFLRLTKQHDRQETLGLTCFICGHSDGPRKRIINGQRHWVHVYCALLSPSVISIRDMKNMANFVELAKASRLVKLPTTIKTVKMEESSSEVPGSVKNTPTPSEGVTKRVNESAALSTWPQVTSKEDAGFAGESSTLQPQSTTASSSAVPPGPSEATSDTVGVSGGVGPSDEVLSDTTGTPSCCFCQKTTGHFINCSYPECKVLMHARCLRLKLQECEAEGRQHVLTCLEVGIAPEGGSGGRAVSAFCLDHAPPVKYCVCGGGFDSANEALVMVGCDVCGDWLHSACIGTAEAEYALQADHYACSRCLGQRVHMKLLDCTWAVVPFEEDNAAQSRYVLSALLRAASDVTGTQVFDIGRVIPSHIKPLPFPDLILIGTAWCWRVEALLLADKIIFQSSAPPTGTCTQSSSADDPSLKGGADLVETKKKVQLKRKSLQDASSDGSSTVGPSKPPALTPATVPFVSMPAIKRKKTLLPVKSSAAGPSPSPALRKIVSSVQPPRKIETSGTLKTNTSQRLIAKRPLETQDTPSAFGSRIQRLSALELKQRPKTLGLKAAVVSSSPMKSAGATVTAGKFATMKEARLRQPVSVGAVSPSSANERGAEKLKPGSDHSKDWQFDEIVKLSSIQGLLSCARRLPFALKYWEKEVVSCLGRCQGWISELSEALEQPSVDVLQQCLKSHNQATLSRFIATLKEDATKQDGVTQAKFNVPKITRISVTLYPKCPLTSLLYYTASSPGFMGAVALLTSEAVKLRTEARVKLFLLLHEPIATAPRNTVTLAKLRQIIQDIDTVPELSRLKKHQVYTKAQATLQRVSACSALALQLKASPKASLSDIRALVTEVTTELPPDADVNLYNLPDLLTKGSSLETQIDWSSLRNMRDVLGQVQHMPITSEAFSRLQETVANVDAWRREFRRLVSLMTAGTSTDNKNSSDATLGHRRNVIVTGQSGYLKDLFGTMVSTESGQQSESQGQRQPSFTQSHTLEEAEQLLSRGEAFGVQCDEVTQLRQWVDDTNTWISSVSAAVIPVSDGNELVEAESSSWNLDALRAFKTQKQSLPFSVPVGLVQSLDSRIKFLESVEHELLWIAKGMSGNSISITEIQRLCYQALRLEQGAQEDVGCRAGCFKAIREMFEAHVAKYNDWSLAVEQTLESGDRALCVMFTDDASEYPANLGVTPEYPPPRYQNQWALNPVVDVTLLLESQWFSYSAEEVSRLRSVVRNSIRFGRDNKPVRTVTDVATLPDDFAEELFGSDDGLQWCISCPQVLATLNRAYDDARMKDADLQPLFLRHSVLLMCHFLMLVSPQDLINHPMYELLDVCLPVLLTSLGYGGPDIVAALLPADVELLRRLFRHGALPQASQLAAESLDITSTNWTPTDVTWLGFLVTADLGLVKRCIWRLVTIYLLLPHVQHGEEERELTRLETILHVTTHELNPVSDSVLEKEVSSLEFRQLRILRLLKALRHFAGNCEEETTSHTASYLESHYQRVLEQATWMVRSRQLLESLATKAAAVTLHDVEQLINESLTTESLEAHDMRERLRACCAAAQQWYRSVGDELMLRMEDTIFAPQLLRPWPELFQFIGELKPQFLLAAVCLPSSSETGARFLSHADYEQGHDVTLATTLVETEEWSKEIWRDVLTSVQEEWKFLDGSLLPGHIVRPVQLVTARQLPAVLEALERKTLLHGMADTALATVWRESQSDEGSMESVDFRPSISVASVLTKTESSLFREAVTAVAQQQNVRPQEKAEGYRTLCELPVTTAARILHDFNVFDCRTSVDAPLYFSSPLVCRALQRLSHRTTTTLPCLELKCSTVLETQWLRTAYNCMVQGWSSVSTDIPMEHTESMTSDATVLPNESLIHKSICERFRVASRLLCSRLVELSLARRTRLRHLAESRPPLCLEDSAYAQLLSLQLRKGEWILAVLRLFGGLEQDASEVHSSSISMDSGSTVVERLQILDGVIGDINSRLSSLLSTDLKIQGPLLESLRSSGPVGGFLAFEVRQRLRALEDAAQKASRADGLSTAALLTQSLLWNEQIVKASMPAEHKTKGDADLIPLQFSVGYRFLHEQLRERKRVQSIALHLYCLMFGHMVCTVLGHCLDSRASSGASAYSTFLNLLPPKIAEALSTGAYASSSHDEPRMLHHVRCPSLRDIDIVYITDETGLLVAEVTFTSAFELLCSYYRNDVLCDLGTRSVSAGLLFDDVSVSTDGDLRQCETPQTFFFHPRYLTVLAFSLDTSHFATKPLSRLGPLPLIQSLAGLLRSQLCVADASEFLRMPFQATLSAFLSNITANSACLAPCLMLPLACLSWRLTAIPYLRPRVVPYDVLGELLSEFQRLASLYEVLSSMAKLRAPTEVLLTDLLREYHLEGFLQQFRGPVFVEDAGGYPVAGQFFRSFVEHIMHSTPESLGGYSAVCMVEGTTLRSFEQTQLFHRYETISAFMLNSVQRDYGGRQIDMSCAVASGAILNQAASMRTLALTASKIMCDELVAHPILESLQMYTEEVALWELTARHVLERLQARQELQHRLLQQTQFLLSGATFSTALNAWNLSSIPPTFVQTLWDAYGLSDALRCEVTLPPFSQLAFPESIVSVTGLRLLHDRGLQLRCTLRGQQLEALQAQLSDVISALDLLESQARSLIDSAKHAAIGASMPLPPSGATGSLLCPERSQLEVLLQQSLFADLSSHMWLKDLFRRCVELEYAGTLAFSTHPTALLRSIVAVQLPVAQHTEPFLGTTTRQQSKSVALLSEPVLDIEQLADDETRRVQDEEGAQSLHGSMTYAELLEATQQRTSIAYCPIAMPSRMPIARCCWLAAAQILFLEGDPVTPLTLQDTQPRIPTLKTLQLLLNAGRQLFEGQAPPLEVSLLKALLGAAKLVLMEARGSIEQWIRLRAIQYCYPVYLGEELRLIKTKFQQKHPDVYVDVVAQENELQVRFFVYSNELSAACERLVQEIQLYRDGQLRTRFIPPSGFPDQDLLGRNQGSKRRKTDATLVSQEDNPLLKRLSAANVVDVILANAVAMTKCAPPATSPYAVATAAATTEQQLHSTAIIDAIRTAARYCLGTIFGDGIESAFEREQVLFDAVGHQISDDFFKGLQKVIVKRLQQCVVARRPAQSTAAGAAGTAAQSVAGSTSLEALLAVSSNQSSSQRIIPTRRQTPSSLLDSNAELQHQPTTPFSETSNSGSAEVQADSTHLDSQDPLRSVGMIWAGRLTGTRGGCPPGAAGSLLPEGPIDFPLWVTALFSPIPQPILNYLDGVTEMQLACEISVNEFGVYMKNMSNAPNVLFLNVVLGAQWSDPRPEAQRVIEVLRPPRLTVVSSKPKAQLCVAEMEILQKEALETAVEVLLFTATERQNQEDETFNSSEPGDLTARLWIIPPVPSVTESNLCPSIPKSNQLVFGILEVQLTTYVTSAECQTVHCGNVRPTSSVFPEQLFPRNLALGDIRSVTAAVSRVIAALQSSSTPPQAATDVQASVTKIPPFSSLRISVPTTTFDYVVTLPSPNTPSGRQLELPFNNASSSAEALSLDNLAPQSTARIPKRHRGSPDDFSQHQLRPQPEQQHHHQPQSPASSFMIQQRPLPAARTPPVHVNVTPPPTERLAPVKLPPWQRQQYQPPPPPPSPGGQMSVCTADLTGPTLVELLKQKQLQARRPPLMTVDPYGHDTRVPEQERPRSPTMSRAPPPWQQNLPFAVPDSLRTLLQGAAAELRNKKLGS